MSRRRQRVRPHVQALTEPPEALFAGEPARELLRVWLVGGEVVMCSADPTELDGPEAWGVILFRVAMHIGRLAQQQIEEEDAEQVVYGILQGVQQACEAGFEWDRLREVPA